MKFIKRLWLRDQSSEEKPPKLLTDDEYRRKAIESLDVAWEVLNSKDNWKLEKQTANGDTVYSKYVNGYGKMFKLTGEVECPPERLIVEIHNKIEEVPKWNPTIKYSRKVQVIDEQTDVTYIVTTEGGGGLVSSREFINLRRRDTREGCQIAAGSSVLHPDVPPQSKYIRGTNGPNCWVTRPVPGNSNRCVFQWLLNSDLHGWLPQNVVDLALTSVLIDYIRHVRTHTAKMKQEGLLETHDS